MKYAICIPSYMRAGRLMCTDTHTLASIHPSCTDHTFLFVRPTEMKEYLPVAEKYGVGLIELSPVTGNIVETRDEILKWGEEEHVEKLFMMDDDLQLFWKPDSSTFVKMTDGNHFDFMIKTMIAICDPATPIVGITPRQFSNTKTDYAEMDAKIIQVFCFHMETILDEEMSFGRFGIPFKTDYAFVLMMLQRGYHNVSLNRFCRNDVPQRPGGCSEMRSVKNDNMSARGLAKIFPDLVTPCYKMGTVWKEQRLDVRIRWKKAFREKIDGH